MRRTRWWMWTRRACSEANSRALTGAEEGRSHGEMKPDDRRGPAPTPPPSSAAMVRRTALVLTLGVAGCGDDKSETTVTPTVPTGSDTATDTASTSAAGTTEATGTTSDMNTAPMPDPSDATSAGTTDLPPMPNPTDTATEGTTGETTAIPPMPNPTSP